jgi:hypothetical protein
MTIVCQVGGQADVLESAPKGTEITGNGQECGRKNSPEATPLGPSLLTPVMKSAFGGRTKALGGLEEKD